MTYHQNGVRQERFGHQYLLREAGDYSAERRERGELPAPVASSTPRRPGDAPVFLAILAGLLLDASLTVARAHLSKWIRRATRNRRGGVG